jgi:hypothetical protein
VRPVFLCEMTRTLRDEILGVTRTEWQGREDSDVFFPFYDQCGPGIEITDVALSMFRQSSLGMERILSVAALQRQT